jgi:hypothetical protein
MQDEERIDTCREDRAKERAKVDQVHYTADLSKNFDERKARRRQCRRAKKFERMSHLRDIPADRTEETTAYRWFARLSAHCNGE